MMTAPRLFFYILIATAFQKVFMEDVDEYSNTSTRNKVKIHEKFTKMGRRSQKVPILPFISQLTHNGDNLFFQPQIVMGEISGPFGYEAPHQETEEHEYNFSNEIIEADKRESQTTDKHETIDETKPDPGSSNEAITDKVVVPEPTLNPPTVSSLHFQSIQETDQQVGSKLEVEIRKPVRIPEPPAYIPLNPPKHPLKIISTVPKCPPTISEIFKLPKCPPSISEKYRIFVCPSVAIPQYKETLEINEFKINPHFPYFLPGAISTNGIIPSIVKFTNTIPETLSISHAPIKPL